MHTYMVSHVARFKTSWTEIISAAYLTLNICGLALGPVICQQGFIELFPSVGKQVINICSINMTTRRATPAGAWQAYWGTWSAMHGFPDLLGNCYLQY